MRKKCITKYSDWWGLFFVVYSFFSTSLLSQAQTSTDGLKNFHSEVGLHFGNLLPSQIDGVTEILPLWGLRGGYRFKEVIFEVGGLAGKARGVEWLNVHLSLRSDFPIEGLVGTVYAGLDGTKFNGVDRESKIFGGGHLGAGIMTNISSAVLFRADMNFNINPGTSLYVAIGFEFRL